MAHFVYILKSLKDSRFYIGSTHNIQKRLDFHNAGLQRSTRNRIPFILVYVDGNHEEPKGVLPANGKIAMNVEQPVNNRMLTLCSELIEKFLYF